MRLEFKKSDPKVAWLVKLCYPGYRGRRTVKVERRPSYFVHDYWDGGSRSYASFVNLSRRYKVSIGEVKYEHQTNGNHFNLPIGKVELEPGVAVIENVIFQGKDLGIRIYVHHDDYQQFIK